MSTLRVMALLVVMVVAGCSDDDNGGGAASVTPVTAEGSTTLTAGDPPGECAGSGGSSPARFDADSGTYAATIEAFPDAEGPLSFDVVQWLSGDDAVAAFQADNSGEDGGPPNDYYVVNESGEVRQAPVARDATVHLVRRIPHLSAGTVAELPAYLDEAMPSTYWWLTFDDGTITGVCEQYTP